MKLSQYLFASMLFVAAFDGTPAQSQEVKAGDLVITQPWVRSAPKGSELTSAYLTIENKGTAADRLVKASTDTAEKLEIQKTSKMGGATTAAALEGGLPIAAGEKVAMVPGSYKLALMKLKEKFKKGAQVPISLEFEKAGKITVSFEVLGAAATGPATPKDDGKKK